MEGFRGLHDTFFELLVGDLSGVSSSEKLCLSLEEALSLAVLLEW